MYFDMLSLIISQRLFHPTFDLGFWKTKILIFFKCKAHPILV